MTLADKGRELGFNVIPAEQSEREGARIWFGRSATANLDPARRRPATPEELGETEGTPPHSDSS